MTSLFSRTLWALLSVVWLAGCAGQLAYRDGQALLEAGKIDEGLEKLKEAVDAAPENIRFRMTYIQAREKSLSAMIDRAELAWQAGKTREAEEIYRSILAIVPQHARARSGMAELAKAVRNAELMKKAEAALETGDSATAVHSVRTILTDSPMHGDALELRKRIEQTSRPPQSEPKLSAALKKPITIEFKDVPLKQVFEVISRTSGLNFVFDKEVKADQKATIFLRDSTIQDAVSLLLLTNQLEQRVLDKSSILIYPNTATKLREYQPLTVKSFFLSNADVKNAANTIKTIIKTKDVVIDERQNMLIIRDTPDAVRLAERLLALHDLPEPEVMLEVEILEIKRSRLLNLGIQWPDQLTLTPLAGQGGNVTLADLRNHSSSQIGAVLTPLTINAKKQDGEANILANPRIRVKNREAAKVLIGDRVPNITTTSTATGFVSEAVQYVDVGLKLDAQPTIFPDNEVSIKLSLEVSNIVNQIQTKSGTLSYQIGTRTASTVLRLKDGENQVLAGLINDEDRSAANKIPGLGDIPVLGRLFGSQRDEGQKTEIVLSITPRLIRNIQRPSFSDAEFDSGTEASVRLSGSEIGSTTSNPPQPPPSAPNPDRQPAAPTSTNAPAGGAQSANDASGRDVAPPVPRDDPGATLTKGNTSIEWSGPDKVRIGETFSLAISIQPGEAITGIPYAVGFDPKSLELISITSGEFLKQGGAVTHFSSRVERVGGQVFATETRPGGSAVHPGILATLSFKAISPAKASPIRIQALSPIGIGGRAIVPQSLPATTVSIGP
ncbi:General secretion pathway protein GspD [Denitratisoma oestradiolicum]|uniref:General secretion pathway protein GspD n=1 Tax=Denitratisoma oestradiolicum TaxID=311182 RepID=A0A6S6YPR3_9PROT|nr:secretin N-terminal domain-containing protein [Denitratisoma oestradiolicum]CAB1369758.1 General secretion pathway protein GspD [Denitratisoma oestradiolicum]